MKFLFAVNILATIGASGQQRVYVPGISAGLKPRFFVSGCELIFYWLDTQELSINVRRRFRFGVVQIGRACTSRGPTKSSPGPFSIPIKHHHRRWPRQQDPSCAIPRMPTQNAAPVFVSLASSIHSSSSEVE